MKTFYNLTIPQTKCKALLLTLHYCQTRQARVDLCGSSTEVRLDGF
jgi:hypothetical protein